MAKKLLLAGFAAALAGYGAALLQMPVTYILLVNACVYLFGISAIAALAGFVAKKTKVSKAFAGWVIVLALLLVLVDRWAINQLMQDAQSLLRVAVKVTAALIIFALTAIYFRKPKRPFGLAVMALHVLLVLVILLLPADKTGKPADDQQDRTQALLSMPYVDWAEDVSEDRQTITVYEKDRVMPGYNLTAHRVANSPEAAFLFDMQGEIVHRWVVDEEYETPWSYAQLTEENSLLLLNNDDCLMDLTWDSRVKWKNDQFRPHHDMYRSSDGRTFTIARKDNVVMINGIPVPILEDYIAVLSDDGEIVDRMFFTSQAKEYFPQRRLREAVREMFDPVRIAKMLLRKIKWGYALETGTVYDMMHANSIEVLEHDVDGLGKKSQILLSLRELDLIAVYDPEVNEFTWEWGRGEVCRQHHPTVIPNGNMLIFDNGIRNGFSRILELDPSTSEIIWSYNEGGGEDFFSPRKGANQRLANGNTLITESDRSRVFEVSPEGEIVWEFHYPVLVDGKLPIVYRMIRLDADRIENLLSL
ncbi:Arylsulfotransferase (ASST) [Anaerohalosphaera lusitana]|uniref:Arylsulfotransferase (ASST) n=1 Tax=Anaerohalosphaera lusitana TaxID=1936003 RepID=A0A1U9NKE4_9BACT|nr:arylsulfotransferase family protein [Anaerohalosphaera lusitana]AQT68369.1 Arylsulfotransferase (ASST) [Anaerohalosphaera lusitana]